MFPSQLHNLAGIICLPANVWTDPHESPLEDLKKNTVHEADKQLKAKDLAVISVDSDLAVSVVQCC